MSGGQRWPEVGALLGVVAAAALLAGSGVDEAEASRRRGAAMSTAPNPPPAAAAPRAEEVVPAFGRQSAPPVGATRTGPGALLIDTFGDDLDPDTWIRSYPWNPDGPTTNDSNGNFNWYLPAQATVDDGVLRLEAERQAFDGKDWISGLASTCARRSFGPAHFEARVKIPEGVALWPAFWLAGEGVWPPEIDIMEITQPEGRLGRFGTNLWSGSGDDVTDGWQLHDLDNPTDWHVWGLTWAPDRVTWWLDGEVIRTETERIPDHEQCVLFNLAVGSAAAPGSFGVPDERTPDRAEMLVDWIRIDPL